MNPIQQRKISVLTWLLTSSTFFFVIYGHKFAMMKTIVRITIIFQLPFIDTLYLKTIINYALSAIIALIVYVVFVYTLRNVFEKIFLRHKIVFQLLFVVLFIVVFKPALISIGWQIKSFIALMSHSLGRPDDRHLETVKTVCRLLELLLIIVVLVKATRLSFASWTDVPTEQSDTSSQQKKKYTSVEIFEIVFSVFVLITMAYYFFGIYSSVFWVPPASAASAVSTSERMQMRLQARKSAEKVPVSASRKSQLRQSKNKSVVKSAKKISEPTTINPKKASPEEQKIRDQQRRSDVNIFTGLIYQYHHFHKKFPESILNMPVNEPRFICQFNVKTCKTPSINLDALIEGTKQKLLPSDPLSMGTDDTYYTISRDENYHITISAAEAETGVISITH